MAIVTVSLLGFAMALNAEPIAAEEAKISRFCRECGDDPSPIRSTLACERCGNADATSWSRGMKVGDEVVWVVPTETEAAPERITSRLAFHPRSEVEAHTSYQGATYYLTPRKGQESAYAQLRALVAEVPERAVIAQVQWRRGAPVHLMMFDLWGETFVLRRLAWPDEVKPRPHVDVPELGTDGAAIKNLVASLTEQFDIGEYKNPRKPVFETEGAVIATPKKAADDLFAALQAAVNNVNKEKSNV